MMMNTWSGNKHKKPIKTRKLKFKSPCIEGVMGLIQKETDMKTEWTLKLPLFDETTKSKIDYLQRYDEQNVH